MLPRYNAGPMAIPFTLPPKGRVALVYSDVRYGAMLHERDSETLALAMERYEALLRRELVAFGGHEVKSEGYAFLAVWERPVDAVRWCVRVQERLLELHWPLKLLELPEAAVERGEDDEVVQRGLRIRMGIHVGSPKARQDSNSRQMKYYGPAVNHVARIAGAAVGGQILLSAEAFRLVADQIDPDVLIEDLGSYRLRGRRGTVQLIQALPASLSARTFDPVRTVDTRRSNVMPDRDLFVGRRADIGAIRDLFGFGVRLVTVFGPSGIGKSRLAQRAGIELLPSWREDGGIWYADVSECSTLDGLLREVAHVLDVPLTVGRGPDQLARQLGHAIAARGKALLILDGFDELIPFGKRTIARWLARSPDVRFLLASTRETRLKGEVAYELGPLTLPEVGESESVLLFERIARTVRPQFRASGSDRMPVFELVRALGGTPLGIQVVAAQMHRLSANEMLRGVAQRTLRYRPGEASDPEDGLSAATAFAWDQMSFWERDAVAQCAVFRGGFDIEAAEAVLDLEEHVSAPWIGDVLHGLVEKKLIRRVEPAEAPGVPRYSLHRRVQGIAGRRLPEDRRAAVEQRHAAHYLALAEEWSQSAHRRGGGESMARLSLELDNLLAVHEHALSMQPLTATAVELALRTALALDPLLGSWGPVDTHLLLLDASLDAANAVEGIDERHRVRALRARAEARRFQGVTDEALGDLELARALADSIGDAAGKASVLTALATALRVSGRVDEAVAMFQEAVELCRSSSDTRDEGHALAGLGTALMLSGDLVAANTALEQGIGRLKHVGDLRAEGVALGNLGVLYRQTGDDEMAERLYREAMELHRYTGNRRMEGVMLGNLGALQYHRAQLTRAAELYEGSLRVAREVGYRTSEANALANLGIVCLEQGLLERAEERFRAALAVYDDDHDRFGQGCAEGYLGVLYHHLGRVGSAREHYQAAERLLQGVSDRRFRGVFRAWSALLEVEAGDARLADELFEGAHDALSQSGDPHLLRVYTLLRESVHLALARQAVDDTMREQELGQVRAAVAAVQSEPVHSGELRLAVARIQKLMDQAV